MFLQMPSILVQNKYRLEDVVRLLWWVSVTTLVGDVEESVQQQYLIKNNTLWEVTMVCRNREKLDIFQEIIIIIIIIIQIYICCINKKEYILQIMSSLKVVGTLVFQTSHLLISQI
eukprot:TRINITY_DN605_c0_g2_i12.p1 TRINITY_DN605_c0_g2~~TRINITY_DN605_c0_g2_i12.p1  ORF type:complete len:116 (-),score=1.84 TRINITY_DN605_c0_g2_i12:231-578(-)